MQFRMDLIERKTIEELLEHGTEIRDIAKILKRSQSCISQEIKKNGGKRLYNAIEAQKNSDKAKAEGNKDKNAPLQHLRKRVDILEKIVIALMEKIS